MALSKQLNILGKGLSLVYSGILREPGRWTPIQKGSFARLFRWHPLPEEILHPLALSTTGMLNFFLPHNRLW
jgi:hypothetical protein